MKVYIYALRTEVRTAGYGIASKDQPDQALQDLWPPQTRSAHIPHLRFYVRNTLPLYLSPRWPRANTLLHAIIHAALAQAGCIAQDVL